MAQISFDALVAKRAQREADRLKVGKIPVLGTDDYLLCRKPTESKMMGLYGRFQAARSGTGDILRVVDDGLYHCCEQLQDPKLREAIGIKDPLDTVPALFDIPTRDTMGADLFRFLGFIPSSESAEGDAGEDAKDDSGEDVAPENPAKN